MQERVGLQAATDGEFRRRSWWLDLIMGWQGFSADRAGASEMVWRNKQGETKASSRLWVTGPIRWRPSATVRAFEFLKRHTSLAPKVTLPAPLILHMFGGGDAGIREGHYKDIDAFWADVVAAYRTEVKALVEAGATYIQFDDTSIAFLCDPLHRETVRRWGSDADALLRVYAARMNEVVAGIPGHVTVTFHQCRGNREGHWMAEGGYDPVADVLFNAIDVHGYFLEYDSARAGGFAPLRLLAEGQGGGARHHVEQDAGAGNRRRPQAAHRRGRKIRAAGSACHQPAVRLFELDRRQSAERTRPGGETRTSRGGRAGGVAARLEHFPHNLRQSPPSCPRLSRASTPCTSAKAWMAGTSAGMDGGD